MNFDYQELLRTAMGKTSKKTLVGERFKLPQVVCEIQGNKTFVKNFGEIVSSLRRDQDHLSKFLFKELATPGLIQGSVLILNAKITGNNLQKKIEDYIKEFVYCKACGEPDTKFEKEERLVFMKCEACGAKSPIRAI